MGLNVRESEQEVPRVARWKPFPGARVRGQSAIQGQAGIHPSRRGKRLMARAVASTVLTLGALLFLWGLVRA